VGGDGTQLVASFGDPEVGKTPALIPETRASRHLNSIERSTPSHLFLYNIQSLSPRLYRDFNAHVRCCIDLSDDRAHHAFAQRVLTQPHHVEYIGTAFNVWQVAALPLFHTVCSSLRAVRVCKTC